MQRDLFRSLVLFILVFSLPSVADQTHSFGTPNENTQSGRPRAETPPAVVQANAFTVIRPLGFYTNRLGLQFMRDLAALGPDSHWIDGGSGEGVAIEQYLQLGSNPRALQYASEDALGIMQNIARRPLSQRAHVTGITYQMLRQVRPNYDHHLRHLTGRLMEDIPDREIGKADLISDLYGVFGYSSRLDQAMAKYLTALKQHGKLYVFADHMDRTTVQVAGRSIPVQDWLRTISGIQIEASEGALVITKTGGEIRIPRLQEVSGDNSTPPVRVFAQNAGVIEVPVSTDEPGPGIDFNQELGTYRPASRPQPLSGETIQNMNQMLGYPTMGGTSPSI